MNTSEFWQIDHLCEIVEEFEHGMYSQEEVREFFQRDPIPGFDIDLWIERKVQEGVYTRHEEE